MPTLDEHGFDLSTFAREATTLDEGRVAVNNFAAGFADGLTLGITRALRKGSQLNVVNEGASAYQTGGYVGTGLLVTATAAVGGALGAGSAGASLLGTARGVATLSATGAAAGGIYGGSVKKGSG